MLVSGRVALQCASISFFLNHFATWPWQLCLLQAIVEVCSVWLTCSRTHVKRRAIFVKELLLFYFGFCFCFSCFFPFSFSCVFVSFFRFKMLEALCFQCFFPPLSQRPNLSTFEALYIILGTWHNQFLVVVSFGSFQMFTWNMVVSPFPSIKKLVVWSSRYTSFFYRKKWNTSFIEPF